MPVKREWAPRVLPAVGTRRAWAWTCGHEGLGSMPGMGRKPAPTERAELPLGLLVRLANGMYQKLFESVTGSDRNRLTTYY